MNADLQYDVALSFAGEDRSHAKALADELRDRGLNVFYDEYEKATLFGEDLYTHLSDVYQRRARFVVMLLSEHYAEKLWTNHERKAAQARAFSERRAYILPVRLDDTAIDGVLPTTGYLRIPPESSSSLADAIEQKLSAVAMEKSTRPTLAADGYRRSFLWGPRKTPKVLRWLKNHRWAIAFIVLGIAIIGLGSVANAFLDIRAIVFGEPSPPQAAADETPGVQPHTNAAIEQRIAEAKGIIAKLEAMVDTENAQYSYVSEKDRSTYSMQLDDHRRYANELESVRQTSSDQERSVSIQKITTPGKVRWPEVRVFIESLRYSYFTTPEINEDKTEIIGFVTGGSFTNAFLYHEESRGQARELSKCSDDKLHFKFILPGKQTDNAERMSVRVYNRAGELVGSEKVSNYGNY